MVTRPWERTEVRGRFRSNSPAACNEAAVLGLGNAMAPLWHVPDVAAPGASGAGADQMPVQLVRPAGKTLVLRSRRFVDFVAGRLPSGRRGEPFLQQVERMAGQTAAIHRPCRSPSSPVVCITVGSAPSDRARPRPEPSANS